MQIADDLLNRMSASRTGIPPAATGPIRTSKLVLANKRDCGNARRSNSHANHQVANHGTGKQLQAEPACIYDRCQGDRAMKNRHQQAGFTLIELVVSAVLTSIMMTAILGIVWSTLKQNTAA